MMSQDEDDTDDYSSDESCEMSEDYNAYMIERLTNELEDWSCTRMWNVKLSNKKI